MRTSTMRAAFAGLAAVAMLAIGAAGASAQGPTPEGTTITNMATASYTDANGNTYADVTASVSVTVGFQAGPVVSVVGSANPASPSVGQTATFTITNSGNGDDQFTVAAAADAGLSIDHYTYNGTDYADLAALNAVLQGVTVAMGDAIDVVVVFDVDAGQGGNALDIDLTATSERDNTATSTIAFTVTPDTAYVVTVTANDGPEDNVPSNGTQYTVTFDVANSGSLGETFDLAATLSGGGNVTIVSVNGTAGATSTQLVGAGGTETVAVVYTVNDVAAGASEDITLTATSPNDAAATANASITVNVVRPAIAMQKRAYRDDQTTQIGAGEVQPQEFFYYRIDITNGGTADAVTVEVEDPLAPSLLFDSAEGDVPADWTIVENTGTVTAQLDVPLGPTETRTFWIRVQVQ